MKELFEKHNTDEFALAIMLFFNQFSGEKVPWVQHSIDVTWEKGIFQNAKSYTVWYQNAVIALQNV